MGAGSIFPPQSVVVVRGVVVRTGTGPVLGHRERWEVMMGEDVAVRVGSLTAVVKGTAAGLPFDRDAPTLLLH